MLSWLWNWNFQVFEIFCICSDWFPSYYIIWNIFTGCEKILTGQADIVVAGTYVPYLKKRWNEHVFFIFTSIKFVQSVVEICRRGNYHFSNSNKYTYVAGGCETFSDVPIRFSKPIRQRLLQMPKVWGKYEDFCL